MLCTTAINTSNTIRTQTSAAECYSSGLDTNSCYYVINIAFGWGLSAGYQPRPQVVDRGTTARYGGQLRYI